MFLRFFGALRTAGVPVSLREHLTFLDALGRGLGTNGMDGLHALARSCLVKDERFFDRFDRAFGEVFKGVETLDAAEKMEELLPVFARGHVAVVTKGGKFEGLITRTDLLNYLRLQVA